MVVDLHVHFPMYLGVERQRRAGGRRHQLADRLDALILATAGRLWDHDSPRAGRRVTLDRLERGGVGVALSVLCTPTLEIGDRLTCRYRRRPPYGAPPRPGHFAALMRQLERVERHLERRRGGRVSLARSPAELDAALERGELALVHCVEGGSSLGDTPAAIAAGIAALARRGVAYVTVAHLFWRHVVTNVPAVPFLSDAAYRRIFPQPEGVGLSELGRAAVASMVAEGVIVDVTHMSERALDDTFALLDELDPAGTVPAIASHACCRLGSRDYGLTDGTVERIAARGGVVGLILSDHYVADGVRAGRTLSLEDSVAALCAHVDRLVAVTGSFDHVAIGSDHDGFIKPTLAGLEHSGRLGALERALAERYGERPAAAIASGNALRVLRAGWRGAPAAAAPGAPAGAA